MTIYVSVYIQIILYLILCGLQDLEQLRTEKTHQIPSLFPLKIERDIIKLIVIYTEFEKTI